MKTLKEAWDEFERGVLVPRNAGEVQRCETRRGFYAGADALFFIMLEGVSDEPDLTAADDAVMNGLRDELDQFAADVRAGKA